MSTTLSTEAAEFAAVAMELTDDERREVLQFMDAIRGASRAARDSAWQMLTADPQPRTREEMRERHRAVCAYLEKRKTEQ